MSRNREEACCCDVPTTAVDGTPTLSHTRLLGRTFIAQAVPTTHTTIMAATVITKSGTVCSVLAAGARGPAAIHLAKAVERGSYRWI